jgi:hypothetical protein
MRSKRFAVALVVLSAAVLTAQERTIWRVSEAPPEMHSLVARADLVIVAVQDSVLRELSDEIAQGGPDLAIASCHIDVRLVTQRFARAGIAVGRTSDRLRNPANKAPAWTKDIVIANAGRRARDVEGYVADLGDRIGVLRPISQESVCASCHGPAERLSPKVRALLAERYPADKAVGFSKGDLRGWFWVEMPKRAK